MAEFGHGEDGAGNVQQAQALGTISRFALGLSGVASVMFLGGRQTKTGTVIFRLSGPGFLIYFSSSSARR
jgi:hypothetical protein|tara:strand:+ start:470 stop:679 length:210 start_codon:yes stop_codon:yes gene_type:complete